MRILRNILLVICILGFLSCQAHEIDPDRTDVTTNPAYGEYFNAYAERLFNNFHPEKHFLKGWYKGTDMMYVIRRDGTIENIDSFFKENRFQRYCKKVIKSTTPYPFPDEIKDELIMIYAWMEYAHEDSCEVVLYGKTKYRDSFYWKKLYDIPSIQAVSLYLEKDAKIKR